MMNKSLVARIAPIALFVVLLVLLYQGLHNDPQTVPSALIGQQMPSFSLQQFDEKKSVMTEKNLLGQVTLLNVWASWCENCAMEQPVLLDIANTHRVHMVGLEYQDDRAAARQWLAKYGNPFQTILFDATGSVSIDWGVYGTPETFLIDKSGVIRYKHIGQLTNEVWKHEIEPLVSQYS